MAICASMSLPVVRRGPACKSPAATFVLRTGWPQRRFAVIHTARVCRRLVAVACGVRTVTSANPVQVVDDMHLARSSLALSCAGQARLVMRQRGNLRLLLNANLWPEMAVNEMDGGKGATFAVVNATDGAAAEANGGGGKAADSAAAAAAAAADSLAGSSDRLAGLTTFAVRFKTGQVLTSFVQKLNVLKKQAPSAAKVRKADAGPQVSPCQQRQSTGVCGSDMCV